MSRSYGTQVFGIRAPIFRENDDLIKEIPKLLLNTSKAYPYNINDGDIIGVTESLVARTQGNYVSLDNVTQDIHEKFGDEVGVVFPIMSRNRFFLILKAISRGVKKVYVQLSFPKDEVGNPIVSERKMFEKGINPYSSTFTEQEFRDLFDEEDIKHPFTGIDYIDLYKSAGDNIEIILSNDPTTILSYTKNILVADIHTRFDTKERVKNAGANIVYSLDEILTHSINGSGFNSDYGLLGSNYSDDETLKLFPRDADKFAEKLQESIKNETGANVEVLVYGDGAFKDPVAGIWELADPVVSPGFTNGLKGTPNEIKLKFLADSGLSNDEVLKKISDKKSTAKECLGTTPRRIVDLVGSLCDLTSGSGDKGTPIIYIKGYFDNITSK